MGVKGVTPPDLGVGRLAGREGRVNDSKQVMLLKSGKPKAPPSYLKTQRVLRLALVWAVEQGWIESAPLPQ